MTALRFMPPGRRAADSIHRTPLAQARRRNGVNSEMLYRNSVDAEVPEVPSIVYDVLSSPGQPLDTESRAFFEPRFGADFSRVRIHTGEQATRSADAVHARAFNVGQHIVFSSGTFSNHTKSGLGLLAHELTHVTQQDIPATVCTSELQIAPASNPFEADAEAASRAIVSELSGRGARDVSSQHATEPLLLRADATAAPNTASQSWEPAKDGEVQVYIQEALSHCQGDVFCSWLLLSGYRGQRCFDLSLAAADHYMAARLAVEGLRIPVLLVKMEASIYSSLKRVGLIPRTGNCPVSPADPSQEKWEAAGIADGLAALDEPKGPLKRDQERSKPDSVRPTPVPSGTLLN